MNWLNYLLQVNLYLILFYGFYRILLRSETFFNLNRGYLVASAALAFFIPLMQSDWVRSWFVTEQVSQTIDVLYDPEVFYIAVKKQAHSLTLGDFIAIFYIIGILVGIARFSGNLAYLGKMMKQRTTQKDSKQAFSFFNMLFVSKELKQRSTIMKHEFVHIRQLHSADVMLFELITIFNWFNPVVYLYKSSIKHIHEFIADEVASRNEASKADYAMLLFQEQFGVQAIPLTNNFFNSSLLKLRIKMLQKERSTQTALMKYGLIAPLFMLMIVVSSATLASKELKQIESKIENVTDTHLEEVTVTKSAREVLAEEGIDLSKALIISPALVDEINNVNLFKKYFQRNILYPSAARKTLTIGKTFIGFSVDETGNISNVITLGDAPTQLNEEVVRVLKTIRNASEVGINEPNNYAISVNFGLTYNRGNGTRDLLNYEPNLTFKGRKLISDFVVMGYADNSSVADTTTVFNGVEQQAEFPGGMNAFAKYLQDNLKYPASAQRANVSGKVYTQFIVKKDGSISNLQVLKGIGFGCDEEAMRVIQSVLKWNPGRHKGEIVNSTFVVPINFQLSE